jgi:hypothetical protein
MSELNLKMSLKTKLADISLFKKIVSNGLLEERKKIEYALNKTNGNIKNWETKYKLSSEKFMRRFQKNEIEENSDTFEWWAELKVLKELEEKLSIVNNIEICQ